MLISKKNHMTIRKQNLAQKGTQNYPCSKHFWKQYSYTIPWDHNLWDHDENMRHFDAKSLSNFVDSNVSIFDSLKQRATEKVLKIQTPENLP